MTRRFLPFFLFIFFAACAHAPTRFPLKGDVRKELIASLQRRQGSLQALKGMATARLGSQVLGGRSETTLAVKRPFYFRLDAGSDLGPAVLQAGVSAGRLQVYWPNENQFFEGTATGETLRRYLSVSLEPEKIVELLLGIVPLESPEDYELVTVKTTTREGPILKTRYLLRSPVSRTADLIIEEFDGAVVPVSYTSYHAGGEKSYKVQFEDYTTVDGVWFPHRVLMQFWDPSSKVDLFYHDLEVNPHIDNDVFKVKIPDDAISIKDEPR